MLWENTSVAAAAVANKASAKAKGSAKDKVSVFRFCSHRSIKSLADRPQVAPTEKCLLPFNGKVKPPLSKPSQCQLLYENLIENESIYNYFPFSGSARSGERDHLSNLAPSSKNVLRHVYAFAICWGMMLGVV